MPSTALTPGPDTDYAIAPETRATIDLFNAIFGSIGLRLRIVEGLRADYDDAIDRLQSQALAIVSANISEEVDQQRATLIEIQTNAAEISSIVAELRQGVLPAGSVQVNPIAGLEATRLQAALAELVAAIATKAPSSSPALLGNPTAPTPLPGDNDTTLATTAFVQEALVGPFTFRYAFR